MMPTNIFIVVGTWVGEIKRWVRRFLDKEETKNGRIETEFHKSKKDSLTVTFPARQNGDFYLYRSLEFIERHQFWLVYLYL